MMSISTTLCGKISHASLFITDQLRNPWQMLAELVEKHCPSLILNLNLKPYV